MSVNTIWMAALLLFAALSVEAADIIHVPADQSTIQAAINAAVDGDTVQVSPGTYVENINFSGKAIRVASEQGPQVTIIDGNQAGSVVTFNSGEGPQSVLNGFTIRNGRTDFRGGGIRIENASPTIVGNIVTDNSAGDSGGGISSSFGSPVIQGNIIMNNQRIPGWSGGVGGGGVSIVGASSAQLLNNAISSNIWPSASGGGISLFAAGTPVIQNNLVTNNSATSQGGGIAMLNRSDAEIVQNVIAGNSASTGGGIHWLVPSGARGPRLVNNTVANNHGPQGSAVFADGFDAQVQLINNILMASAGQSAVTCGTLDASSIPSFQFNDVVSITGLAYAGSCANQTGINNNISADPIFKNPAAGDYRLSPGSPAIDAGTSDQAPPMDLDAAARPADGNSDGVAAFDMGAYEAPLVDTMPPVTMLNLTPVPNSSGWNSAHTSVTLTATDSGAGVQSIQYSLSGAQNLPAQISSNPAVVTITTEGSTTINYFAADNAGNVEQAKSAVLNLDWTGPILTGMPQAGCTLSPPKHQLVQVAVVGANDALSGVANLHVSATSSEPDSGVGGGDVPGDIVINGGTVLLRAERAPSGKGRTYTIVATATDVAGNTAMATATCVVPK